LIWNRHPKIVLILRQNGIIALKSSGGVASSSDWPADPSSQILWASGTSTTFILSIKILLSNLKASKGSQIYSFIGLLLKS